MREKLNSWLGLIIDSIPAILVTLSGCSNQVLIIASMGLFITRFCLELKVLQWIVPVTTLIYFFGGVVGIFLYSGILEIIAVVIICSRILQIVDYTVSKSLFKDCIVCPYKRRRSRTRQAKSAFQCILRRRPRKPHSDRPSR